ncbi:hypothetical protein E4T47_08503 [Aureobasidium subglaciale]|nr:hypothetical protein E4T47_08503 [Aureobasidium subglaciale]
MGFLYSVFFTSWTVFRPAFGDLALGNSSTGSLPSENSSLTNSSLDNPALAELALTQAGRDSELCTSIEERRYITPEEARDEVGPWFKEQYNKWKSSHTQEEERFWTWFTHKYAPGTADSIADCKLESTCSTVHCSFISDKYDLDVQRNAFFAMESVSNFHNLAWSIKNANKEAFDNVESDMSTLMLQFSDGKNVENMHAKYQQDMKLLMHGIIGITLLLSAVTGGVSGLISLSAASEALKLAGEAEQALDTAQRVAKASKTLLAAKWTQAGNLAGLLGSLEVSVSSAVSDFLSGPAYSAGLQTAAEHGMAENQHITAKIFDTNMISLLQGYEGMTPNFTLVDMVQRGHYANVSSFTPNYRDQLRNMWFASAIGTIWSTEHSYIIVSDVKNGGCKGDHRGPKILKTCLEEFPTKVFYTYFKSNCREGLKGKPLIRGPPGHHLLEQRTNFTLKDVVRSSMTQLKDHANNQQESRIGAKGFDTMFGDETAISHGGGRARGLFMLSVCYTPKGQGISSINMKTGRNFPCSCYKFPWSEHKHAAEMAPALQRRDMLKKRKGRWTGDPKTTYNFLLNSGIWQSRDFRSFCRHRRGVRKTHGNGCKRNKDIHWQWPGSNGGSGQGSKGGKDKKGDKGGEADITIRDTTMDMKKPKGPRGPKHPFKKCRVNPHKYIGCETKNDGYHRAKGCDKQGMALDTLESGFSSGIAGRVNTTSGMSDIEEFDDVEYNEEIASADDTDGEEAYGSESDPEEDQADMTDFGTDDDDDSDDHNGED